MCFISKKKFTQLQKDVAELIKVIKTQELEKLRVESKELKEIKELISHVQFKIKDIKAFEGDEIGKTNIRIIYQLPTVVLTLDENGNPNKNDFFYSTNMLDMISIEDMQKVQKIINQEKNKMM